MKYIKGFDGLRAVSILLVILTHLDLYQRLPKTDFVQNRLWHLISGDTGVMIFFVLSGFLITSILLNEKSRTGSIKIARFFARRFIRLLPALLIFYAIVLSAYFFGYLIMPIEGFIYALFYVYNFVPNQFYIFELGHLWSLSLEEQFYMTWPFVVLFFTKIRNYLILFSLFFGACIFAYFTSETNQAFENYKPLRFFIPAISPISLGCLGAVLNHFYASETTNFSTKRIVPILAIALFCFPLFSPAPLFPITSFIQSIGIALLLLRIFHHSESLLVKVLEYPVIKYVGTISYGLYIFQGFFLRTGGGGEAWIHHTPWNLLLTFTFAILSFELIERRTLRLKKKFQSY